MTNTFTERALVVLPLLREYADKLTQLNRELLEVLAGSRASVANAPGQVAWLLDRAKRLDRPMRELVNGAASEVELPPISFSAEEDHTLEHAELVLRLGETEAQLHHMLRQAAELQKRVDEFKMTEQVARLRESAGLNAMKGGPLRPNA